MSNAWEETLNVDFMQDFYLHGFECHGSFTGFVLKYCSTDKILCFKVLIFFEKLLKMLSITENGNAGHCMT